MFLIDTFVRNALQEDIGSGDVTTDLIFEESIRGVGTIISKENMVVAGLEIAQKVFEILDPDVEFFLLDLIDGREVKKGDVLLRMKGSFPALLRGERTALNFLQRLSGIATITRRYAKEAWGSKTKLVDTRKTIPCWRFLEKYAVRVGGGFNHRMGLYDGVLVKDNHITACGSISRAVGKVRNRVSHLIKIEVEVSSLDEVEEALLANVDVIMLDNMKIDEMEQAIKIIAGRALVEISGGINLDKFKELIPLGADFISVGALTHSAVATDISMQIKPAI